MQIESRSQNNILRQIYEKRLNSLADTFLFMLNNLQNNMLFKQIQCNQLTQKIQKFGIDQIKKCFSSYRIEYLKTIIEQIMRQKQQNTIVKLQVQNLNLKNEKQYLIRLYQFNNTQEDQISSSLQNQNSKNYQPNLVSQDQEDSRTYMRLKNVSAINVRYNQSSEQSYQQANNKRLVKSKLNLKWNFQQNSQDFPHIQISQPTSFVVPLRQNSSNCISSIDHRSSIDHHFSQGSSIGKSQKRTQQKNHQKQNKDKFIMCSLRQQLQMIKDNNFEKNRKIKSDQNRKNKNKKRLNLQNQQNEYLNISTFKYLKL